MAAPAYLKRHHLEFVAGADNVERFFDDDDDGLVEGTVMNSILLQAEGVVSSKLLLAFGSGAEVAKLAESDAAVLAHASWIAMELASERRPEFVTADGWGRYKAQYERAEKFLDDLVKTARKSHAEGVAGTNAQHGGQLQPAVPTGGKRFTFAADKDDPIGPGGF